MAYKLISLLVLTFTCSLIAEQSEDELFSMTLDELLKVKVTGSTLTEENIFSVPAAVTIYSRQEIERMGLDYLNELANLVPGFQSYRTGGTPLESPMSSRGRRISVVAAEILVMVDGRRVDGPRSSGMAIVVPKFPLKLIERVEFIRGPGAAIYGSNAMMGVINIITGSERNQVGFSYGSFNRRNLDVLASKKFDEVQLEFFAQFNTDDGEDYNVNDTFSLTSIETSDPRELINGYLKLNWQDSEINLWHYQFDAEDFYELDNVSNGFNQRHGRLSGLSFKQSFSWRDVKSWIRTDFKESRVNLSAQFTPPGFLAPISLPSSNETLLVNAEFDDYTETSAQWHNDLAIEKNSNFQFGLELRYIDAPEAVTRNNFDLSDLANGNLPIRYYGELVPTTPVQTGSKRDILGLYVQYLNQFTSSTELTLGLRYWGIPTNN